MKKHEWFMTFMVASLVMHEHGFVVGTLSFIVWALLSNWF